MEDWKSKVTFSGVNPSHATSKVVERQIQKWIDRQRSLSLLPKRASYTAHLDREGERLYTCHIEIQIGSREWIGLEEGRSIHEAVQITLKYMRLKERISLRLPGVLTHPALATA